MRSSSRHYFFPTSFWRNSWPPRRMKIPYPRRFGERNIPGSEANEFRGLCLQNNRYLRRVENGLSTLLHASLISLYSGARNARRTCFFFSFAFHVVSGDFSRFILWLLKCMFNPLRYKAYFPSNEAQKKASWNDCCLLCLCTEVIVLETCFLVLLCNRKNHDFEEIKTLHC